MSVHLMCVIAQAINVIVHTHSLPRQQLASKLILINSYWIHSLLPEVLGVAMARMSAFRSQLLACTSCSDVRPGSSRR